MFVSERPSTATLVSPGVWVDAHARTRYVLDPSDATLLLLRAWTSTESAAYDSVQATNLSSRETLKAAIGERVAALNAAKIAADTLETSETTRAAAVTASTPAATVAYLTLVRDEVAALHLLVAQMSGTQSLSLAAVADLATVVSSQL